MSGSLGESPAGGMYAPAAPAKLQIPGVVRRNTILLALSQAFVGAGMQMVPALGALVVLQVTGSTALAGIGAAILAASRFLVAYPAGKLSDRSGRKPVLFLGLLFGMVGAILTGLSVILGSMVLMVVGFLVLGLGMGGAQQIRVAAADMYPPSRRGQGMGYVLTGSLIGVLLAPALIALAQSASPRVNIDPLGLPWLFVPVLVVPALFLVFAIRPDPQDIAMNMGKHYPGCQDMPRTAASAASRVSIANLMRHYPKATAMVASLAVQGNMSMMMFLTSLVLHQHGHQLASISVSVSIHVIGMYGFMVPLGWASDRVGRRPVLLAGAIIAGAGSIMVPASPEYWVITTGTFLVGLGWSAVYVAATALIADTTSPEQRGSAVGVNDTFSYIPGIVLPLAAGPLVAVAGFGATGLLGMALMVPPILLLLRLREPSPGRYLWGAGTAGENNSR